MSQAIFSRLPSLVLSLSAAPSQLLWRSRASSSRIPLLCAEPASLDRLAANEPPGSIVLVRAGREGGRVIGLGFYEPEQHCLEMFEWLSYKGTSHGEGPIGIDPADASAQIPVPDVEFFHRRIMAAYRERLAILQAPKALALRPLPTNAARLFHGAADGIPSLFITRYGHDVHVCALSSAATQLVPLTVTLAQRLFECHSVTMLTRHSADYPPVYHARNLEGYSWGSLAVSGFADDGVVYARPEPPLDLPPADNVASLLEFPCYIYHPLHHIGSRQQLAQLARGGRVLIISNDHAAVVPAIAAAIQSASSVFVSGDYNPINEEIGIVSFPKVHHLRSLFTSLPASAMNRLHFIPFKELAAHSESLDRWDIIVVCGLANSPSLIGYVKTAIDTLKAQSGRHRGTLIIQCGSNSLATQHHSIGGRLAPRHVVQSLLKEANRSAPGLLFLRRWAADDAPGFPHRGHCNSDARAYCSHSLHHGLTEKEQLVEPLTARNDNALPPLEEWDSAFYDTIVDIIEKD